MPAEVLGLGVDLCEVERLRASMARTAGMRDRLFTPGEQTYCEQRSDPAERYAVRFAAKEAVLKAMGEGLGACAMRDIEVVTKPSGAPRLVLHASAAKLAASHGVAGWLISLTHTSSLAQATVLALGSAEDG